MESRENNKFDVSEVKWQSKEKEKMFFIDDDRNPFNGEMTLFRKTEFNKYELSKIKCRMPADSYAISKAGEDMVHLSVIKDEHNDDWFSNSKVDCIVEPFDKKSEL